MAESVIEIHPGLSSWLEASSRALASQVGKLALFEKEGIYAEYWVQNELSFHLPWSQPGYYFVDRGPGLAIPNDTPKYPDFILRFGNSVTEPVFFLELKDFLVNSDRNRQNLFKAIEIMRYADRIRTLERWQTTKTPSSRIYSRFSQDIQRATFFYGGLGVGDHSKIPSQIPESQVWRWPISDRWVLFLSLVTGKDKILSPDVKEHEETYVDSGTHQCRVSNEPEEMALKAALECERTKNQQGVDFPLESKHEADRFKDEVEKQVILFNLTSLELIKHAKPWVWLEESSGGRPMTSNGRTNGIEVRFSFHAKGNGL